MSFLTTTALRYLRARRGFVGVVTGFAITGIVLGVAALIVVTSVMNGFREELLSRILGLTGHVVVSAPGLTLEEFSQKRQNILAVEGVLSASPFVLGQAMVISPLSAAGSLVRGVPLEAHEGGLPGLLTSSVVAGDLSQLANRHTVAIGSAMSQQLGAGVGSRLTLLSPEGKRTIAGFIPRMLSVEVAAVFDIGMHQYDAGLVYMNIRDAQTFFRTNEGVTGVDVRLLNPADPTLAAFRLEQVVGGGASAKTWQEGNRQFFEALEVERVAMFIILSLIVLVAAFNIITGQMMMVNDKRGDIAILRTMGLKRRGVLALFFFNGALVGGIGTVGGLLAGLLVVHYLTPIVTFLEKISGVNIFSGGAYFLDYLPARVVAGDVLGIALLSLALSLLAGLYPAGRAARMNPVEILRGE